MYCWSEENNNKLSKMKNDKHTIYRRLCFFGRLKNDSNDKWRCVPTECIKSINYLVIKNHNQNLTTLISLWKFLSLFCFVLLCCCKTPGGTHSCPLYLLLSWGNDFVVVVLRKKTKHQSSRSIAWFFLRRIFSQRTMAQELLCVSMHCSMNLFVPVPE